MDDTEIEAEVEAEIEAPETGTYEHVVDDDGTEVRFTFRADPERGSIRWEAEWGEDGRSGYTARLSDEHGAIMYPGSPRINGEATRGSKLDEELLETLEGELAAVKAYREAVEEAVREAKLAADLALTVTEHAYKTGTHRTKYTHRERVLLPAKKERFWTDDEECAMAALRSVLGEADGKPRAGEETPFADVDEGVEVTLEEASDRVDGFEEAVAEVEAERGAERALEELHGEHPVLRGTGADPDEVAAAFDQTQETWDEVEVAREAVGCSDSSLECSTDLLSYRATPEGEIEVERTHTY